MSIDDATPAEWDAAAKLTRTRTKILKILQETLDERQEALRNLPTMPHGEPNTELYFITRELGIVTDLSKKIREVLK
jgi:hypothetical protein